VGFLVAVYYFVDPPGFFLAGANGWWGALLYVLTGCGVVWFMQSEHTAWLRTFERDIAYFDRLKELDREGAARKPQAECEMLASIVDTAQNAILSVTPEGRIATWNAAAERSLRFSAREVIGQPLALIVPPEHQAEQERLLQQISRGERTEEWHTVLCGKGGCSVAVSLTLSPVKNRSGVLIGASLIVRNQPPKR
jgi:PAS domain S-box-containing protein